MWQYDYHLSHGLFGWTKKDHKYIDKFKNKVGEWVYVYNQKAKKGMNTLNDKLRNSYKKLTSDNKFVSNKDTYAKKVEQIKNTKEWKSIVTRKDPEYVKKNKDGTYTYDIDKYMVDKKHPVLDVISDFANGRELDTNEITKESIVAGISDYIQKGMAYLRIISKGLEEGFKYRQGSYQDEQKEIESTIQNGIKFINEMSKVYDEDKNVLDAAVDNYTEEAKSLVSRVKSNPELNKTIDKYSNNEQLNNLLKTYTGSTVTDYKVRRYANTISELAKRNGTTVDEILSSKRVQDYLRENNISKDQIKKYL